MQQDKHIHNCMLLGGLDDQDPAQWADVDVQAICVDYQLQEADRIVDLRESTSDSGESEDQRPSLEVENRHASGTGSLGREDSGSGAAEKASNVDTEGVGRAPLVIPQPSMCSESSESSDSDEIEHAQDDESGDDDPKGKGVKESKGQGRGWGRGKRTNNSGADGGRALTRARR